MKVGLVTITELDNFGNRLQNLALQNVLTDIGCTVETIPNLIIYGYRRSRRYQIKRFIVGLIKKDKTVISEVLKFWRFAAFDKEHFAFSKYFSTINTIPDDLNLQYDCFIAGSDQIWNPYFAFNFDFNFLSFASKNKRIAYAASFGTDHIPDNRIHQFKTYLRDMFCISVRESSGRDIVQNLTKLDVEVMPDPTLLLKKEEWELIQSKPMWHKKEKYLLLYFLGGKKYLDSILQELFCINPQYQNYKVIDIHQPTNIREFSINPAEFIYLINNAELVITDSFHGTVFSIIMGTPFIISKREDSRIDMDTRISSLFSLLNMDRNNFIINQHIDEHDRILDILVQEQRRAKNYLSYCIEKSKNST